VKNPAWNPCAARGARKRGLAAWVAPIGWSSLCLAPIVAVAAEPGPPAAADLPAWFSILPPLVAIAIALLFRSVVPALMAGVWVGAWGLAGLTPAGAWQGLLATVETFVIDALADRDHQSVIVFSMLIAGMVGIVTRNGGMQGVVERIRRLAGSPRRVQLATTALGVGIFFDDYANTMVVGNAMRPLTDAVRVSREKLAYLVDSTAAPVASVAFITTWIGYEIGIMEDSIRTIDGLDESAYLVLLRSLPYSFYPWLAMAFLLMVVMTGRDFGAMHAAESRARTTGRVSRLQGAAGMDGGNEADYSTDQPHRAFNAWIPVLVLIVSVLGGLWTTGDGQTVSEIIGSADSYKALLWGSSLSISAATLLSVGQRLLTLEETIEAMIDGMRRLLFGIVILALSWALAGVTEQLDTAGYLVSLLEGSMPPEVLPAVVFVLAAATSFATGTSWGTMGILMPLALPLAWSMSLAGGEASAHAILHASVAAVLAGAVWGDHCSPISDTTILSSVASSCNHIDHVRTQLPYALTVGLVAGLGGFLLAGYGIPWWLCMLGCMFILLGILRLLGRPS
jgi:Na+/H+ antiporter NhaC